MNEFVSHIDVVDVHQHFWDLSANRYPWLQDEEPIAFRYGDYSPLRRNYLPVDYRRDTAGCGIVHTVHVEAERDRAVPHAETRWLGRLATAEGLPTVLVAHARLDLARRRGGAVRTRCLPNGSRHPSQARRRQIAYRCAAWRGRLDGRSRLATRRWPRFNFSFDLQTPWWHLDAAVDLARDFPATTIVINHTALPADRSAERLAAWRQALTAVADCANVALKISGLGQRGAAWTPQCNVQASTG